MISAHECDEHRRRRSPGVGYLAPADEVPIDVASANVAYEAVGSTLRPNGLAAVALENVQLSYIDEETTSLSKLAAVPVGADR